MTRAGTPPAGAVGAEVYRRVRLARLVCSRSARYVARNAAEMGVRDAAFVAVVTGLFLSLALFAPDYFPDGSLGERSVHAPVGVE
jgi:hypothetical protein